MKVLTYTSYKEYCELYVEIHNSIAVNGCQIEFAQKYSILLPNVSVIFYMASSRIGVENNRFIKFGISAVTYSIDNFNTKIKEAVSQQRLNWEPPQINNLKLVIPQCYTFMASNIFLLRLVYLENILKRPR